jgi:hypothetical protein
MGLFKSPKQEKEKVTAAPEQRQWAGTIMPWAEQALTGGLGGWMGGAGTPGEQYWSQQARTAWENLGGLPGQIKTDLTGLLKAAENLNVKDYSGEYLEQLQKQYQQASSDVMKRVASQMAAQGGMYGSPTTEAIDTELARTSQAFATELANALRAASQVQMQQEALRQQYLLPYYEMLTKGITAGAEGIKYLPSLEAAELTPEEARRNFFLNLLQGIYTLSPEKAGYTYGTSPFENILALAGTTAAFMPK